MVTGLERESRVTLGCQCLKAAASGGTRGSAVSVLRVHCVPICICVHVSVWGMYVYACKWVPIWPHKTNGPVLGWWRQAFWQECSRLLA